MLGAPGDPDPEVEDFVLSVAIEPQFYRVPCGSFPPTLYTPGARPGPVGQRDVCMYVSCARAG